MMKVEKIFIKDSIFFQKLYFTNCFKFNYKKRSILCIKFSNIERIYLEIYFIALLYFTKILYIKILDLTLFKRFNIIKTDYFFSKHIF